MEHKNFISYRISISLAKEYFEDEFLEEKLRNSSSDPQGDIYSKFLYLGHTVAEGKKDELKRVKEISRELFSGEKPQSHRYVDQRSKLYENQVIMVYIFEKADAAVYAVASYPIHTLPVNNRGETVIITNK